MEKNLAGTKFVLVFQIKEEIHSSPIPLLVF
jgi:hypothetical protein